MPTLRALSLRIAAGVGAVAFLAACGEATAPAGPNVDVTVRAYVDADNSGAFSDGDQGISGLPLALTDLNSGASTAQATTDASGNAVFQGVAPGSYSVAAADAPAGTVLTTGTQSRVTVSYTGSVRADDLRYAFLPGTVTGRIYRDDNTNGSYDESDTPGAGLSVTLRKGSQKVDSVVTNDDGIFRFRFLAPGDYSVSLENPGTISYGDAGATRNVSVDAGSEASLTGVFTGSLIISVADVRTKASGSLVAILGRLTVKPGQFVSGVNSELWVQDATGGMAVFSVPTADSNSYALGDTLEVSGNIGVFSGQMQLSGSALRIVKRGRGAAVSPLAQTVPQARSLANEGRLVTIPNVRVASVPTGTGAAFTVLVHTGDDTLQVRVASNLSGLSRASFIVGDRYSITGVLTQFNGTAQVKIRSSADLQSAVTPIGTLREQESGTVATVTGNITVRPGLFTSGTNGVNSEIWIQDATGGIAVFAMPTADTTIYKTGDRVEITGTLGGFNGQLQLATPTFTRIGAGSAPAPIVLTGPQVKSLDEDGKLVTLNGFTVTSVPTGSGAAFTVAGTADGESIQVRVAAATGGITRANFTVGNTYSITGVLTQFNGTAQIKVRQSSDVTP